MEPIQALQKLFEDYGDNMRGNLNTINRRLVELEMTMTRVLFRLDQLETLLHRQGYRFPHDTPATARARAQDQAAQYPPLVEPPGGFRVLPEHERRGFTAGWGGPQQYYQDPIAQTEQGRPTGEPQAQRDQPQDPPDVIPLPDRLRPRIPITK